MSENEILLKILDEKIEEAVIKLLQAVIDRGDRLNRRYTKD